MAFTAPTASDLKTRFPAFAAVADATITTVLTLALDVAVDDETWISQTQYTEAALLYTAHVLTLDGLGTSAEAELAGSSIIRRFKSGSLEFERANASTLATSGAQSILNDTTYGRRYQQLLKINQPPVKVLNGTA